MRVGPTPEVSGEGLYDEYEEPVTWGEAFPELGWSGMTSRSDELIALITLLIALTIRGPLKG